MAYQDKQTQDSRQDGRIRPEEQFVPDQYSSGVPNSLMQSVSMATPPGMPNSVMRELDQENSGALFRSRGSAPAAGAHGFFRFGRRGSAPSPVTLSISTPTIQRAPGDENDFFKRHPEVFLTGPQPTHPGAAAAAAESDSESEEEVEEDPEMVQMESDITRGQTRVAFLDDKLSRSEIRRTVTELDGKIKGETDPQKLKRLTDFRRDLLSASDELKKARTGFKNAQRRLDAGEDVSEIRAVYFDAADSPYKKMQGLIRLEKAVSRFHFCAAHPNIPFYIDDEDELNEMGSDFTEVEGLHEKDFEVVGHGTQGDYDEQLPPETGPQTMQGASAAAAAPAAPSVGTVYNIPAAAAAPQGEGPAAAPGRTPGDYDAPPAEAAPKKEPEDEDKEHQKKSKFQRAKEFFHWDSKKK